VYPLAKSSLLTAARQQLRIAQHSGSGRSSALLCSPDTASVRHVVLALRAGERLERGDIAVAEACTVQVLQGRISLRTAERVTLGWPGDLLVMPTADTSVWTHSDAVLLLTSTTR
jgi:hypothetical protein